MDDNREQVLVNVLFKDRGFGYATTLAILITFLITAGFLYSSGRTERALLFLVLAILLSTFSFTFTTFFVRLMAPARVSLSDDGVVLHYAGKRSRNIKWSGIRTLRYDAPVKSFLGKKNGDVVRFVLGEKETVVIVDNRISLMLKKTYQDWCARTGRPVNIAIGRRTPIDKIIAGEVNRRRGAARIAFGVAYALIVVTLAYVTVGLSYLPFTILILILVFSCCGFFVLFGVAELLGDARYLKVAVVSAVGGLISVSAFLVIATLRLEFLFGVAGAFALIAYAYTVIWRKMGKTGQT